MKKVALEFVSVLITGLGLFLLSTIQVSAQPLVKNTPTGSLTDGANISINPEEPLPANGTVSISTEGATDSDMNVIPPEGVTVIISSDTVTVTNQPVDIATDEGGDAGDEGDEGDTGGGNEEGDEEGDENEGEGGIVGGNQ
jgi:TATA-binding protein-associated factor Taf7